MAEQTPHHHLEVEATIGTLHLRLHPSLTAAWTVLFGPSGSGKSTVLRAMCGLLSQATTTFAHARPGGWDELDGKYRSLPSRKRQIAYAPQTPSLFPSMTVRENVAFASSLLEQEHEALVEESMQLFELETMADRRPHELSGGERQRVSLARAFAVPGARLMLLDEPFTGVGRTQRNVLLQRMRATTARRGIPVISVTHDVEEAFLLEAEVVRMERGTVVAQGPAEVVLAEERAEMLQVLRG
jgi:molybdate transport system ATP-binding protein